MSNVVEFKKKEKSSECKDQKSDDYLDLEEIMRRNKLKEEEIKRNRNKANRGVIRSHNLKRR